MPYRVSEDYVHIGEIEIGGTDLPVYVTSDVANRAIDVDYDYSGIDDPPTRALLLYEAAASAIATGRREFSIEVADRSWSRNPEEIPFDRISLTIEIEECRVLIGSGVRQINPSHPLFAEIAANAAASLNRLAIRTCV